MSTLIDPLKQLLVIKAVKPIAGSKLCTLILPDDRVFSCQADGSVGTRDPGTEGAWEKCRVSGTMATFKPVPDTYFTFAFVEGDEL